MTSSPPSIQVNRLAHFYGALKAVDDLTFQVSPGEVYGLLGPNGAGKTTTLRALSGLLTPSSGEVLVGGLSIQEQPLKAKEKLGYLTGDTALWGRLTPRETLRIFARLSGWREPDISDRIEALSRDLSLRDFIDRRCDALSSGQRQRTAIARALVHDPQVLILDEPTATLDVLSSQFILERLRSEADGGKAVLFSSHQMPAIELVCDRIGVLHQGRLLAEGTLEELCAHTGTGSMTQAFLALINDVIEEEP